MTSTHVSLRAVLAVALVLGLCKAPAVAAETGGQVLGLAETLQLAQDSGFEPIIGCAVQLAEALLNDKPAALVGPLQRLRTGAVLQAFYRFRRTDCVDTGVPPLVLLPPLNAAMAAWGPEILSLLSCGRELIVMENRGAGMSMDDSSEPLTYYTMADAVLELTGALNLTRPDVLGWSTGGDIALMLAALHGDRVGRVIGISAVAGSNNTVLPDIPDIFNPEKFNELSMAQTMALNFPPQNSNFEENVCAYMAGVLSMPHGTVTVNDTVFQAQYEADTFFSTVDSTVWDALPNIENPVLLVQGAQDVSVPPANLGLVADRIPGAQQLLIPDWGHALVIGSAAEQLAAAINKFLRELL